MSAGKRRKSRWANMATATSLPIIFHICISMPVGLTVRREKVRQVLRQCYVGSRIGQGYIGDEDNGEMSAWFIFSAMGFIR